MAGLNDKTKARKIALFVSLPVAMAWLALAILDLFQVVSYGAVSVALGAVTLGSLCLSLAMRSSSSRAGDGA